MANWTERDVPDQSGRVVLVTGANSGIGLRTSQVLAGHGARVLLGCRSPERAKAAQATIAGDTEIVHLDLADLDSVRTAAERVREITGDKLDALINNAAVMAVPRDHTADGFERQFGTNHLGHAALTWLLMPALRGKPGSRVVTLSSPAARFGQLNLADLNFEHRRYSPSAAYGQAKLANLLFALELHRRAKASGLELTSVATHPGFSATSLGANSASAWPALLRPAMNGAYWLGNRLLAQSAAQGALPTLYAATAPDVQSGAYYAPDGPGELRGRSVRPVTPPKPALDPELATKLWIKTAELTGVAPDPA